MSGDQVKTAFQSANPLDLGIIGAGVLVFIFSLFPYYTASFAGIHASASVWHGFFGWFGVLLALAAAALVAVHLLKIALPVPTRLAVLGLFGVATLCTLLALFIVPGKGDCQGVALCENAVNYGHGFGYWATLLFMLGGLGLSYVRKDATD